MDKDKLKSILEEHTAWCKNHSQGKHADLQYANLPGAELHHANLQYADFLSADLPGAELHHANLQYANLRNADLRGANLRGANLQYANLRGANLRGADLDFSCWPLWCGSKGAKVDRRLYLQLLAHLCAVDVDDDECIAHQQVSLELAKQSHRAEDLEVI